MSGRARCSSPGPLAAIIRELSGFAWIPCSNSPIVRASRTVSAAIPLSFVVLMLATVLACFDGSRGLPAPARSAPPLTASRALGLTDPSRDASLRLVMAGLDEDAAGRPARARAGYQRAIRVDPTNPFAYLALARQHLESGSLDEADAFLDQARTLFESEGWRGPGVDVWGFGLRAGIERERGRDEQADRLFDRARALAPEVWRDERLAPGELR